MRVRPLMLILLAGLWVSACGDRGFDDDAGTADGGTGVDGGPKPDGGTVINTSIQVTNVFDGDTVRVAAGAGVQTPDGKPMSGETVRFLGIDAPEIAHDPTPADCWGDEAHEAARNMLQGRTVSLEFDPSHEVRDTFGRLLAYIHLPDGQVANEILLREGHARSFRAFPHRDTTKYNQIEAQAKQEGLGMWSCP